VYQVFGDDNESKLMERLERCQQNKHVENRNVCASFIKPTIIAPGYLGRRVFDETDNITYLL